jgi:hypothetical protein
MAKQTFPLALPGSTGSQDSAKKLEGSTLEL